MEKSWYPLPAGWPDIPAIIKASLEQVDPCRLIDDNLKVKNDILEIKGRQFDLNRYEKIHVIGAGKAATFMWQGIDSVMGDRIHGGVIVSLGAHRFEENDKTRVRFYEGAHPIPDSHSIEAGNAVTNYIHTEVRKNDLVFVLISGGASAMMAKPLQGIDLEDKIEINRLLLASGVEVTGTNCVRKQLSALKGGKLAEMIEPAQIITLVLSDIIDSPLDAIGSGPSIPDSTTRTDALTVLKKYGIFEKLNPKLQRFFLSPQGEFFPKERARTDHFHVLLGDNSVAVNAAADSAKSQGIPVHILTTRDKGEAGEAAKLYSSIIKEIIASGNPFKSPVLLVSGGELTVTIAGTDKKQMGRGGRNHAFVLEVLRELKGISHPFFVASMGTDGIDGTSDAAGAWITHESFEKAEREKLDPSAYIADYDSHTFFQRMDQQIKTGPTRTNVMDLRLIYIFK